MCANVDSWCTCFAVALYVIHSTQHLYDGLRVSIFSHRRTAGLITFLSDLAFPIAAGLSLVAHSPDFLLQTGEWALSLSIECGVLMRSVPSVLSVLFVCLSVLFVF